MHLRSLKKSRGEVSIYDPIGVDKEGNEISISIIKTGVMQFQDNIPNSIT